MRGGFPEELGPPWARESRQETRVAQAPQVAGDLEPAGLACRPWEQSGRQGQREASRRAWVEAALTSACASEGLFRSFALFHTTCGSEKLGCHILTGRRPPGRFHFSRPRDHI